ncbi:MAG: hypothetical protein CL685_01345 [Candidatus Magasanikbacteria bacterium]|nr:hypothetical protein [Candidatus Magasanikbacteria bacterium]
MIKKTWVLTNTLFFVLVYAVLFIFLEETMEDPIMQLPQIQSNGLHNIFVGVENPRPKFIKYGVPGAAGYDMSHATRLSVRDSFKKVVQRPSFWYIPRSEDVVRILTAAHHVHLSRVRKGEKRASDPITVITVGDGYGDIPALILTAARKEGLHVTCQVISTQATTRHMQKGLYGAVKGLSFFSGSQLQMLLHVWGGQPYIVSEISTLADCIIQSRNSLVNLHRLIQLYVDSYVARNISSVGVKTYARILREDFGVQFPSDFVIRSGTLYQMFQEGVRFTQHMPLLDFMSKKYSEMWNKGFVRIEELLVSSCKYGADMVLQTIPSLDCAVSVFVRLVRAGIVGYIFDCRTQKDVDKSVPSTKNVSFDLIKDTAIGERYMPFCAWRAVSTSELTGLRACDGDIFAVFPPSGYGHELSKKQDGEHSNPVFLLNGCVDLLDSGAMYREVGSVKSFGMFGWEKSPTLKGVPSSCVVSLQDLSEYSVRDVKRLLNP